PAAVRPVAVIPGGDHIVAVALAGRLRQAGFGVELGYSGNMKKRLQRANKLGARAAVILGEDEASRGAATLRDLDSGEQSEVPLAGIEDALSHLR
ncbi:MAG: histidine--tRNA ligase, partial [Rhodospirillales bacterium]|nr:histidine--tRNA ligase [Rhodospirillales bacterium]